jgi:hypothetical protein
MRYRDMIGGQSLLLWMLFLGMAIVQALDLPSIEHCRERACDDKNECVTGILIIHSLNNSVSLSFFPLTLFLLAVTG